MTNKEGVPGQCKQQLAKLLAVNLVGQVLDEARYIANAALESGLPWDSQTMIRDFGHTSRLGINEEEQGDSDIHENNIEELNRIVATSTPQKHQGEIYRKECNYIGQGDEDLDLCENELTYFKPMFVNHLFDMSDLERFIYNEPENVKDDICKRVDSPINYFHSLTIKEEITKSKAVKSDKSSKSSESSQFSYLADAYSVEIDKTNQLCVNNVRTLKEHLKAPYITVLAEVQEFNYIHFNRIDVTDKMEIENNHNEFDVYEDTYLTLNREYDQSSEDDGEPFLQDSKGFSLHEIELIKAKTSEEKLYTSLKEKDELSAVSMVSASGTSCKSTLARRCKLQGVKLLSCFKGWWHRKPSTKTKEIRFLNSNEGMRSLSPNARRRTSSLLDNRIHRTPSRPII